MNQQKLQWRNAELLKVMQPIQIKVNIIYIIDLQYIGMIRDYNEDRVSIILNIMKPKNKAHLDIIWP